MAAAFSLGPTLTVRLESGDVFDFPADALLMGRTAALRSRIERRSGQTFESVNRAGPEGGSFFREVSLIESPELPWAKVYSLGYRPRRADPRELIHANSLSHTARLKIDIFRILVVLLLRDRARQVAMTPLSWRNPDVICSATTSALWALGALMHESENSTVVSIVSQRGVEAFERWLNSPPKGIVPSG